ncbi:helix-turn-helix transcriptional regulator [Polyangium sp. 15x6]|uniref:helix-turn-helix domain-containing protein n=1 Tax=Polyangium sp. 15x6 TaxID=3042687 RepID=UPI00249BC3D3|nr:helix-turn-helix transcriptional regulator [Polyangium sp. 15x6]MDI3291605.1 helix-turn-helix transcriptional regulator [Polyangium sp. 15x6]
MPRRTEPSPLTAKVGARIHELRIERGLTLEELATRAGNMSKGHLSSVENGLAAITIETVNRVATGLGVPPLCLLTFADEHELAKIAELARKLPSTQQSKIRRELQVLAGLWALAK